MSPAARLHLLLRGLLVLALPFVIYFALQYLEPRVVSVLLVLLLLLRAPRASLKWLREQGRRAALYLGLAGLLGVALWFGNSPLWALFYPVIVSAVMFTVFAGSLLNPPTVVERIARLRTPDLPPNAVAYTRHVTQIWCVFFVVNAAVAAWTALAASAEIWVLYNGLVSYLLMGCLFAGEWLYRRLRLSRQINA